MRASHPTLTTFLATHPVFRVEDFVRFHAHEGGRSPATSHTLLKQAVAAGRLLHVRRGVYAAVPLGLTPEQAQVDRLLLASAHTPDAVVAFHAALELHGRAYSTWRRVHVWTHLRSKPWSWRGVEVVPVQVPLGDRELTDAEAGILTQAHAGGTLRVTSLERTLVDLLDQPDKGGGWEEILRSLDMIEWVDVDAVVAHTLRTGRALTASRVGWLLTRQLASWHVGEAHLGALREVRASSATYLDSRRAPGRLDTAWNLVVPDGLPLLAAEGDA